MLSEVLDILKRSWIVSVSHIQKEVNSVVDFLVMGVAILHLEFSFLSSILSVAVVEATLTFLQNNQLN